MTELPLPPDPTPEEVAYRRRLVGTLQDAIDVFAVLDLPTKQRQALNDASRRAQSVAEGFADLDAQMAGRPARKAQRGKVPRRGARRRVDGPKATTEDVQRLLREMGR